MTAANVSFASFSSSCVAHDALTNDSPSNLQQLNPSDDREMENRPYRILSISFFAELIVIFRRAAQFPYL